LRDWFSLLKALSERFNMSVFGVEYPGYGPAEGLPNSNSVNDNVYTAYNFLTNLGFPHQNVVLFGYSIGTGPTIQLASELCTAGTPPGALITISAFTSIRDIIQDLKGVYVLNVLGPLLVVERWNR
jgi:surfactin synthase thioesterase subunit